MQLFNHGQWWSNVWNTTPSLWQRNQWTKYSHSILTRVQPKNPNYYSHALSQLQVLIMGCHANQTFKFIYNVSRMFASPSQRVQVHTAKEVSCVTVNVTSYHSPESDFNQIDSTAIEKTPTLMFLPLPDTYQLHAHRLTFSIPPPPPPVKEKQIASVNKHSKFVTAVLTSIQLLQTLQCEQRGGR